MILNFKKFLLAQTVVHIELQKTYTNAGITNTEPPHLWIQDMSDNHQKLKK